MVSGKDIAGALLERKPRNDLGDIRDERIRGYFGAGQGVILLAVVEFLMAEPLQQINALKNVLQAVDNAASALLFVAIADIDWLVVALFAGGAIAGGQLGARLGPRLPSAAGSDRRHRHRRLLDPRGRIAAVDPEDRAGARSG
jgi:hypothetical protein